MLTADSQTNPLLLPRRTGRINGLADLLVTAHKVRVRLLGLLLDILHQRILLDDDGVQVLEQLLQLDHGALDLLDRVVALLHIAQRALRLASAVRVEQRLLEDLCVAAVLRGFPDLGFRGFGVDDQVLAALLLLHLFAELRFLRLVRVDRLPYPAVQGVDLRLVHWLLCLPLALDALYTICQPAVAGHDVGGHGVDFFIRGAIAADEAALHALQVGEAVLEIVNRTADGAALVEDGIGVASLGLRSGGLRVWSALVKRLHFDVVLGRCGREGLESALSNQIILGAAHACVP